MDLRANREPVLIIAYDYPPASPNVGRVRPSKFVKYLPQFGWQPMVLTVGSKSLQSPSDVYHVKEWPHPLKLYYRFQEQRAKRMGEEENFALRMGTSHANGMSSSKLGLGALKRRLIDLLCMPDQELSWLVPAVVKGLRIIRQRKIRHLVTTAPPYSVQLVGLALKRLTGVRWIADYRDPWSLHHQYLTTRDALTNAVESRLIRQAMRYADVVVSATPPMTDEFIKEHPSIDAAKFVTITNGFDPDDFLGVKAMRDPSGKIQFSYVGEFYNGRTPEPFLSALKSLIDERIIQADEIRVRFVGNVAVAEGQSVAGMIERLGLKNIVSMESLVPREEAIKVTLQSHILLVLTEKQPHALPFKFYDALGSGGIVLNIGCGGAVADILKSTRLGLSVDYRNLEDVRNGILKCISQARTQEWAVEPWTVPKLAPFNFHTLTGRLVTLLDGPTSANGAPL